MHIAMRLGLLFPFYLLYLSASFSNSSKEGDFHVVNGSDLIVAVPEEGPLSPAIRGLWRGMLRYYGDPTSWTNPQDKTVALLSLFYLNNTQTPFVECSLTDGNYSAGEWIEFTWTLDQFNFRCRLSNKNRSRLFMADQSLENISVPTEWIARIHTGGVSACLSDMRIQRKDVTCQTADAEGLHLRNVGCGCPIPAAYPDLNISIPIEKKPDLLLKDLKKSLELEAEAVSDNNNEVESVASTRLINSTTTVSPDKSATAASFPADASSTIESTGNDTSTANHSGLPPPPIVQIDKRTSNADNATADASGTPVVVVSPSDAVPTRSSSVARDEPTSFVVGGPTPNNYSSAATPIINLTPGSEANVTTVAGDTSPTKAVPSADSPASNGTSTTTTSEATTPSTATPSTTTSTTPTTTTATITTAATTTTATITTTKFIPVTPSPTISASPPTQSPSTTTASTTTTTTATSTTTKLKPRSTGSTSRTTPTLPTTNTANTTSSTTTTTTTTSNPKLCGDVLCGENGKCDRARGTPLCQCTSERGLHWTGINCNYRDSCDFVPCGDHGSCDTGDTEDTDTPAEPRNTTFTCICNSGWGGTLCSEARMAPGNIAALIICILLFLAILVASFFLFRFVRRSRKLKGKYNPAKEELQSGNGPPLPMVPINKEERLI